MKYFYVLLLVFLSTFFATYCLGNSIGNDYVEDYNLKKFIGIPLSPPLGSEPPAYGEDHKESGIEAENREKKVVRVGTVLLKNEKLYYLPLLHGHMAVEWWRLTGKTEELTLQLEENEPFYCKLKGRQVLTKVLHKIKGFVISGYHVEFYTFDIEDILWVKTEEELVDVKATIDTLSQRAFDEYKATHYKEALPLFEKANSLARKFLPNKISGEREVKKCQDYLSLRRGSDKFKNNREYLEFLNKMATEVGYRDACSGINNEIRNLIILNLEQLHNNDKETMEEMLINSMENEIEKCGNVRLCAISYGKLLIKLGGEKTLNALKKYEYAIDSAKGLNKLAHEENQKYKEWIITLERRITPNQQ